MKTNYTLEKQHQVNNNNYQYDFHIINNKRKLLINNDSEPLIVSNKRKCLKNLNNNKNLENIELLLYLTHGAQLYQFLSTINEL